MSPDIDMAETIRIKLEEALQNRGRVNVLIAGRSGVGKSTLVNAVFQGNIATTGQGRPVTQETREYTKEGLPVSIFDTRGLEMESYKETLRSLDAFVEMRLADPDPTKHIHVAWLCISEDSRRVEEGESSVAAMLAARVPVLAVLTKSRNDQGFRAIVQSLIPKARNVVRVRALRETDDEGHVLDVRGLEELVDATMELVPDGQRMAFAASQRISIDLKKKRAHMVVAASAATAAAIGANPIPFSDAVLLVPVQIGMLAGISGAFGLDLTTGFLSTLVSSAAAALGGTFAGRAIVGGLLKMIPGVGSVVGGAISGGTAATLTTIVGELYIKVLSELFTKAKGNPPSDADVAAAFGQALETR